MADRIRAGNPHIKTSRSWHVITIPTSRGTGRPPAPPHPLQFIMTVVSRSLFPKMSSKFAHSGRGNKPKADESYFGVNPAGCEMTADDRRPAAPLSRRTLLRGAGYGVIATIGGVAETSAQQQVSKQVVAYQDQPNGDKRCDRCVQFQPPMACKVVQGQVRPEGFCRLFVARPRSSTSG